MREVLETIKFNKGFSTIVLTLFKSGEIDKCSWDTWTEYEEWITLDTPYTGEALGLYNKHFRNAVATAKREDKK